MDLTDKRQNYDKGILTETDAPNNPFILLKQWLQDAIDNEAAEPYAMSLATCGDDMQPSVRTVLLREVTESGLIFYTNYLSHKGEDIEQNPQGECLFFWQSMQRQLRVRGEIKKVSRATTEAYFKKRPYESQIGAWVSQPQSGEVNSREVIDNLFIELKEKYTEKDEVPTPDYWGGYELSANEIEFWQGGVNRLHDRLLYSKHDKNNDTDWVIKRLLP